MTLSQAISPHLPYLRRFSRALSGSQTAGDAYAVATLEAILAEPQAYERDLDPRMALYKVFLQVWGSVSVNVEASSSPESAAAAVGHERLETLTPHARAAFLLSATEGYDPHQIALIFACPLAQAEALLADASQELANQMVTDVLIIEDEPIIAMDIEALVESLGHRVTEIARTHAEALAAAKRQPPGLILADVQLADGSSGLEAVNQILQTFAVPVIFITAYPERLLTGERPEPTFLITKPFRAEMIKAVVSQALFFNQRPLRRSA